MPNLFAELDRTARRYPSSPAFASSDGVISFETLAQAIENVADNALANGLAAGELVHVDSARPQVMLLLILGLLRAGMTVGFSAKASTYLEHGVALNAVLTDQPANKKPPLPARKWLPISLSWFRPVTDGRSRRDDDPDYGLVVTSSGTTGRPKLIRVSRTNIEYHIAHRFDDPYFSGDLRYLSTAGNTSFTPTWADYFITLIKGGLIIRIDNLTARPVLDASNLYLPSYVSMTPATLVTVIAALERTPRRIRKTNYLRLVGAYCAEAVRRKALALYADQIVTVFGVTEIGQVAIGVFDGTGSTSSAIAVEGLVGEVISGVSVETVDDSGSPLSAGAEGEFRIRPLSQAAARYLEANGERDVLRDGWFYPGDIGRVDSAGQLIFRGRKSAVMNLGGRKLSPEVVEAILIEMPSVRDVAVAPLPTPQGYQSICALIVGSSPVALADVQRFLARRKVRFSVVAVKPVSAIPRTERGKIDRPAIKALAESQSRLPTGRG